MPPRPHIRAFDRLNARRDVVVTDLKKTDPGRPAWDVGAPGRVCEVRARRNSRRRVTLTSIVGVEAVVFLAILDTLARGPVDLRESPWTLVGLSILFLVLSQLRRRATASTQQV